jgi:hypothetical protein
MWPSHAEVHTRRFGPLHRWGYLADPGVGPTMQGTIDPSHLGAKPQRMVRARVIEQSLFDVRIERDIDSRRRALALPDNAPLGLRC